MNPLSKEANAKCAIFTVCNIAYLPKALVLASSLKKFGAPKLIIYLFDKLTVDDFVVENYDAREMERRVFYYCYL